LYVRDAQSKTEDSSSTHLIHIDLRRLHVRKINTLALFRANLLPIQHVNAWKGVDDREAVLLAPRDWIFMQRQHVQPAEHGQMVEFL
jgi:hypothetical protein